MTPEKNGKVQVGLYQAKKVGDELNNMSRGVEHYVTVHIYISTSTISTTVTTTTAIIRSDCWHVATLGSNMDIEVLFMEVECYNTGVLLSRKNVKYLMNIHENSCRHDDNSDASFYSNNTCNI